MAWKAINKILHPHLEVPDDEDEEVEDEQSEEECPEVMTDDR